jgi:hypothetical protein
MNSIDHYLRPVRSSDVLEVVALKEAYERARTELLETMVAQQFVTSERADALAGQLAFPAAKDADGIV